MPALTPLVPTPYELKERGVKDGSSPSENFEIDATSTTRKFKCLWAYRYAAVKYLLGYAEIWDDAGTLKLSRLKPHKHPYLDGLYATKVTNITGFKWEDYDTTTDLDGIGVNEFHHAELTVLYEHVPFSVLGDAEIDPDDTEFPGELQRWVEQPTDIQPSGEYLQMPGATMRYIGAGGAGAAHGKPVPFNSGKIIPQEIFHVVWHRLPYNAWTPDSNLFQRVYVGETDAYGIDTVPFFGAINRTTFLGRPKGTVLLNNVMPKKRKSPLGVGYEWDLVYEFAYKPSGWNWLYFFNPGTLNTTTNVLENIGAGNGWYFVGTGVGGTLTHHYADTVPDNYSLYNARDLNKLFSVDV